MLMIRKTLPNGTFKGYSCLRWQFVASFFVRLPGRALGSFLFDSMPFDLPLLLPASHPAVPSSCHFPSFACVFVCLLSLFFRICISLLRLRQSVAKKAEDPALVVPLNPLLSLHSIINEILHFTLFTLVTPLPIRISIPISIPFAICCSPLFGFASCSSFESFSQDWVPLEPFSAGLHNCCPHLVFSTAPSSFRGNLDWEDPG